MSILTYQIGEAGLASVKPRIIYIDTNDTVAAVTASGYLNTLVDKFKVQLQESDMALVTTKTSPSATSTQVGFYEISYSSGQWSLTASAGTIPLASGDIFVGNASGVANGVTMSGDATIATNGTLTIANDAIDNAKIADNAVSLENLDSGITPSHVTKFAAEYTTTGGAAAEAITVNGVLATDLAFVQMVDDGTNNVTVLQAATSADTLTVTFSGDPGNDAVINYQIIRAAS